jgi:hypothetical protein
MTQLTLLTRAYKSNQIAQIEKLLKGNLEGLDVKMEIASVIDGWVKLELSGQDETIATNFIRKEIGLCPESLENVKRYDTLKGYITELRKNPDTLHVDVGVFQPQTIHAVIPLSHLQAAIVDERKLALKKISELFGFCDNMPLQVKVTVADKNFKSINAELANIQLERFRTWRESLLDRLIVLGASIHELRKMLRYTGLDRDIVSIESLGMFEHALTCKLGTDAAGLISEIGKNMGNVRFQVFNPRNIKEALEWEVGLGPK